jgi:spore photoproduct lyase
MSTWKPREIIIHQAVINDSVTQYFLQQCPDIPTKTVSDGRATNIVANSQILSQPGNSMLAKILAGKQVVYIAPATNDVVDTFTMPDSRMLCPHFERLKLAANGCFYQCDWCYLKLTYRAAFPFITVRAQYDKIKDLLRKRLGQTTELIIFNSGELADSLSMEHLTRAAQEFIPWFGRSLNGYLFLLTKSDNVDEILDLPHNGHTIIAWSLNHEAVSRRFEIGAPTFERRLMAASKVQQAGYRVRVRLDPVVPFAGWEKAYAETIARIFAQVNPERITLGTLRFEPGFYKMRQSIFTTGPELPGYLERMQPMFEPQVFPGSNRPRVGKYSFLEEERVNIFRFVIHEVRKYSNCPIALCKESSEVWDKVKLDSSAIRCACQL